MNPHAHLLLLAQAATPERSTAPYWITLAIVLLVLALFVGLVVYAALRSREEGTPREIDPED